MWWECAVCLWNVKLIDWVTTLKLLCSCLQINWNNCPVACFCTIKRGVAVSALLHFLYWVSVWFFRDLPCMTTFDTVTLGSNLSVPSNIWNFLGTSETTCLLTRGSLPLVTDPSWDLCLEATSTHLLSVNAPKKQTFSQVFSSNTLCTFVCEGRWF